MDDMPIDSEALRFAVAAGLPPRMAYSVKDTARYSGVSLRTIYAEHRAGRLKFKTVGKRKALIAVSEMDRWMSADN